MLDDAFVKELIHAQLHEGDVQFANGSLANNHLDLGYNEVDETFKPVIIRALGELISTSGLEQSVLVPVPTGAEGWVENYNAVKQVKNPIVKLKKVAKREFELLEPVSAQKHINDKVIVIDDATSDGGTGEAAADYMVMSGFAVSAVISLFVRGSELLPSKYPRLWLAHSYIPTNIDWKKFHEQGKIEQLTM